MSLVSSRPPKLPAHLPRGFWHGRRRVVGTVILVAGAGTVGWLLGPRRGSPSTESRFTANSPQYREGFLAGLSISRQDSQQYFPALKTLADIERHLEVLRADVAFFSPESKTKYGFFDAEEIGFFVGECKRLRETIEKIHTFLKDQDASPPLQFVKSPYEEVKLLDDVVQLQTYCRWSNGKNPKYQRPWAVLWESIAPTPENVARLEAIRTEMNQ